MPAATVTSKGRITIPQIVRIELGLHPGAKVDFIRAGGGFQIVPLRTDAKSLKGRFVGRVAKPVAIEAMDQAIGAEAARRNAASTRSPLMRRPRAPRGRDC